MSERDDMLAEIAKSDDGRQTTMQSAANIVRIMGVPATETEHVRNIIGESGLSPEDLIDEILDEYEDGDEFDDAGDDDDDDAYDEADDDLDDDDDA